ncbi:hypothetical protein E4U43_006273 [Claviceps pusilla]|uniref:Protein HRI1 n=1 Tax=Claviceps pusilla TaxID=123648 RepID=A0A9P7SYQ1_9HYPO|nr:hypothetical protein E4U43_006273 [Claviceps pusilla]
MPGTLSIRKSIRWIPGPEQAHEPTSTMVLTSPEGRFVDVRVLKGEGGTIEQDIPPSRLDWAIAGTSSSQTIHVPAQDKNKTTTIRRCRFEHWLDSRTSSAAPDQGDMYQQQDGTTLEIGRMVNPETGLETDYEEVWWDEEHHTEPGSQECVVLRYEKENESQDEDEDEGGMVVRLGEHAQAFVKRGGEMAVGRWRMMEGKPSCVVGMGSMDWMPGEAVFTRRFDVGETCWTGGVMWVVVEVA